MENLPSPTTLLLCEETIDCLEDHHKGKEIQEPVFAPDDDDYIRNLLVRETVHGGPQSWDSSIQNARLDGINYILKKSEVLGFSIQTAYTSVAYLDKFLSKRSVDTQKNPWAVGLLSIACLSLAAKMDEVSVVPPLPEFCTDDYSFESSAIQNMELLVLNELGWTMVFITPISFIDFFATKLIDHSAPGNSAVSRIEQAVLNTTRDVKIMSHKPSVIAAATTLYVLDQGLTADALRLKVAPLASSHSLDIGSIISCYFQVQEMQVEKSRTKPYGIGSSAKRRRLMFYQIDDQSDGVMKGKGNPLK